MAGVTDALYAYGFRLHRTQAEFPLRGTYAKLSLIICERAPCILCFGSGFVRCVSDLCRSCVERAAELCRIRQMCVTICRIYVLHKCDTHLKHIRHTADSNPTRPTQIRHKSDADQTNPIQIQHIRHQSDISATNMTHPTQI